MDAEKTCTATFTTSSQQFTLTVGKSGTGAGTVASNPSGINCGSDCAQDYAVNTQVQLTAIPNAGSIFSGWSGDPDCSDGLVNVDAPKSCTVTFTASSEQFALTVDKSGAGSGTVTSSPAGINCGSDCTENYLVNTQITLIPTPDVGSIFTGWSGDPGCGDTITLNSDKICTATFEPDVFSLTITKGGIGTGTVTSNPPGINCGGDCAEAYGSNTQVTLTATPDEGFVFSGWDGDADCSDGTVTIDSAKICTARFGLSSAPSAYVTNNLDDNISVIDTSANIVIDTVNVGSGPTDIAISPDGAFIYVANKTDNNVSVVDELINSVITTVSVGLGPEFLAVSPDGSRVYVVNEFDNSISVIDASTNTVVDTIPVGDTPKEIAFHPDGTRAYVTNHVDGTISVINTSTNTVIDTVTVGILPKGIAVNPDGASIYVANSFNDNCSGCNSVSVIDTSTNSVIDTVNLGGGPWSVEVNPDGTRVYVGSTGTVSVIDTSTNTMVDTVSVGGFPVALAISFDGAFIYVVEEIDNIVSVIDTLTNSVVDVVSVGNSPEGIAIAIPEGAPLQQFVLTVNKSGAGTVTSNPTGIICGNDCKQNYASNTVVTLTATPDAGSSFTGWSGDPDCPDGEVTMDATKTCTATFNTSKLTVTKIGTGTGTVTSSPAGIDCGTDCMENYAPNTQITLTATPSADSVFAGWSGDADCSDGIVTMDVDKTCTATFNKPKLTVTKTGTGTGTVTSSPTGINCGSDCTENYPLNTQVTLTATPGTNAIFTGWSGDPDCSDGIVTMDTTKTCTATFDVIKLTITKTGTGTGTVTSSPAGINCGSDCTENYALNTQVALTATPGTNSAFAGWNGDADCSDGVVIMDTAKTCTATFNTITLTVTKTGTGTGTVTSSPTGINCGSDCTQNYNFNTQVTLTAAPASGSVFGGWSGDTDCTDGVVIMDSGKTCTATFTQASGQFTLTLKKAGTGTGTVTSSPAGIDCGSDCYENYSSNTQVTLTATPSADSVFAGWSGTGCTTGVVTMSAHRTCTATFNRPKLTVTRNGTGTGTVTSSPAGINCGSDCNENYDKNTQVTLTAAPATGSTFAGWSGNADCSDGVVTVDVDKTCTATFNKPKLTVTKTGTGTGTVTSSPSGINCGSDCNQNYNLDTQVTLTATPSPNSTFTGWSGDPDCSDGVVTMDADKTCTARFDSDQVPPTISITSPSQPVINDPTPEIVVTYSDDNSGVNLSSLKILVDATDITSNCTVNSTSATCPSPTLSEGQHTVSSEIRDLAGNLATDSFAFEVDAEGDPVSQLIEDGGGIIQVTLPDGTIVTLEIPPGALMEDTEITLTPISQASKPDPEDGSAGSSFGVDFQPDGLEFLIPASLKVEYTDDIINALASQLNITPSQVEDKLVIYNYGAHPMFVEDVYQPLRLVEKDEANNTITVELPHFSSALPRVPVVFVEGLEIVDPLRKGVTSSLILHYNTGTVTTTGFNPVLTILSDVLNVSPSSTTITFGGGAQTLPFTGQSSVEDYGNIMVTLGLSILYQQTILVDVPDTNNYSSLLSQYAPVLKFTQGNNFFPTSVEESFSQGPIFLQRGFSEPIILSDLGIKASNEFSIDFPDGITALPDSPKVVYGTAVDCKSIPDRIALQYWFHYFRDDKEAPLDSAQHEGDWEMITVFVEKDPPHDPIGIALSQHFSGQKLLWKHVQKQDTHPVVYVAKGSHANYPRSGTFEITGSNDVALGNGIILSPQGSGAYELRPLPRLTEFSSSSPESWLLFSGTWGTRKFLDGFPPDTPSFNGLPRRFFDVNNPKWLDPCEWASNIPTNVYVSNENILGAIVGVIQKINSQTGDRKSLYTYEQSLGDITIDPYGVLYIGSDNGVKRLDVDTGQPLQDVGLNIFSPTGPSIDYESCDESFNVSCDVYFNTAGFPNDGIWVVPKGVASDAVQVTNPFTSLGRGTAFLTEGTFASDLIAAGHTFEPGVVPEWNRIVRVPMNTPGGPELFTDLSVDNPDLGEQKPVGLAVNSKGEVFVSVFKSEEEGDLIRIIEGEGKILRLDHSGGYNLADVYFSTGLYAPQYIAFDMDDNLYVTDPSVGVWKITPDGNRTVLSNFPGALGIEVE